MSITVTISVAPTFMAPIAVTIAPVLVAPIAVPFPVVSFIVFASTVVVPASSGSVSVPNQSDSAVPRIHYRGRRYALFVNLLVVQVCICKPVRKFQVALFQKRFLFSC